MAQCRRRTRVPASADSLVARRRPDGRLVPAYVRALLRDVEEAVLVAQEIGFSVMIKSTAGGGGRVSWCVGVLRRGFPQARTPTLFHHDGLFIVRYYPSARHVEVQMYGDGHGHAMHMGERECSVQRRHQKVIEEAPNPFMIRHLDVQAKMCAAAVRLAERVQYESAGTVEFLVDDHTAEFFLEMNTRLQVEHPVTEQVNPGLDIVELMILQGITKHYDPFACKLIATGSTRPEAIESLSDALARTKVAGPPNNLRVICASDTFKAGNATTTFLESFSYTPRAFTVLSGGIETTVQDCLGRRIGLGMPRSGPMDAFAFRMANVLVGNGPGTEGLEMTLTGFRLLFHSPAVVAVTGAPARVAVDGVEVQM
ncbi:carbamoyl-phosphate synthase L chain, ATP binding domain-containing protein [Earliella scabrosa]|nr:carbamoyl-phosphate synthase L chain, ATP binding domain-containing protein [Earliella scabrosa]